MAAARETDAFIFILGAKLDRLAYIVVFPLMKN